MGGEHSPATRQHVVGTPSCASRKWRRRPEPLLSSPRSPPMMHGECQQKLYKDAKRYSSRGPPSGEVMFSSLTSREVRLTVWRNGALEKTSVPTAHKSSCVRAHADTKSHSSRLTAPVPPTNPQLRCGSECTRSSRRFHRPKCLSQYWKKFQVFRKEVSKIRKQTVSPTRGNLCLPVRTSGDDEEGKESAELVRRNMKSCSGASPRRRTRDEIMAFQMFRRPVVAH